VDCLHNMTYEIYIVECKDGTYYTGYSHDVNERLLAHNTGRGAKYTRTRRPVRLVYAKGGFPSIGSAMKEEARIKKLTRNQKKELIYPLEK
jgi:putative endonuclease